MEFGYRACRWFPSPRADRRVSYSALREFVWKRGRETKVLAATRATWIGGGAGETGFHVAARAVLRGAPEDLEG